MSSTLGTFCRVKTVWRKILPWREVNLLQKWILFCKSCILLTLLSLSSYFKFIVLASMAAVSGTSILPRLIGFTGREMCQSGTYFRFLIPPTVTLFNHYQTALIQRLYWVPGLPSSCSPWCPTPWQVSATWQGLLGMTITLRLDELSVGSAMLTKFPWLCPQSTSL